MAAHQVLNILGVSEQSDECRHEEEGVQEGGEEAGDGACHIGVADLPHATEDVAEADAIKETRDEALHEGEERVNAEEHDAHRTGSADADALQEAGETEYATGHRAADGSEYDRTDRDRNHVKRNCEWANV